MIASLPFMSRRFTPCRLVDAVTNDSSLCSVVVEATAKYV